MPEAENHTLPGATNDSWRTWLMTGAQRHPVDRRRLRGANKGLKRILLEGVGGAHDRPHAWTDFSGAMVRHAVDDAMRSLPPQDTQVVKLAYFGGYSNREIANLAGLTEGTVERRLRRAISCISEHIQRGRTVGRRALYAVAIWLSGRSAVESAHHFAQAVVVASAAAIMASQPAPPVGMASGGSPVPPRTITHTRSLTAPVPSPSPQVKLPAVQSLSPAVNPAVRLPVALPPLPPVPVKVKPPSI